MALKFKKSTTHQVWTACSKWVGPDDVGIVQTARSRFTIVSNPRVNPDGTIGGSPIAWRSTLRAAKERAEWAGLADLGGADDDYPM